VKTVFVYTHTYTKGSLSNVIILSLDSCVVKEVPDQLATNIWRSSTGQSL